jgi:hypothetical protein
MLSTVLLLACLVVFYLSSINMLNSSLEAGERGSLTQDISYALSMGANSAYTFFSTVLIFKSIERFPQAYGSLRGLAGATCTSGVVLIYYTGRLLSKVNPVAPFLVGITLLGVHLVLTSVLMCFKQLRI